MNKRPSLNALVRTYITSAGAQKKQMLDDILAFPNAERRIFDDVFGDDQRACLRVLADACRRSKSREKMTPLVVRNAQKLLSINDAKARKTASNLIGTCAPDSCADALLTALKSEQTRFVRPSMILALGNTADPLQYLGGYSIEPGEEKHVREESDALKKAMSKTQRTPKASGIRLPSVSTVTYINKKALIAELEAHDIAYQKSPLIRHAFNVPTDMLKRLRCYDEAMFPIGDIDAFAQAAAKLDAFGCSGLSYRIEAGQVLPDKRKNIIETISKGLAAFDYQDNPYAYAFEIRIVSNHMFALFPNNRRFTYRKQSISASINPVTAASVMRLCGPYMKKNADVLDPFCGSGTMLIERGLILKTNSLVGVDISPVAIKAAIANRSAARLRIALIKGDILGYGASRYDEVFANMPFGIRVSDHESNIALYTAFADKLNTLLKDDGMAFLYTQEKKLLRSVFENHPKFVIVNTEKFESGGLSPTLFFIKRS